MFTLRCYNTNTDFIYYKWIERSKCSSCRECCWRYAKLLALCCFCYANVLNCLEQRILIESSMLLSQTMDVDAASVDMIQLSTSNIIDQQTTEIQLIDSIAEWIYFSHKIFILPNRYIEFSNVKWCKKDY